jgi:hypothetical protein
MTPLSEIRMDRTLPSGGILYFLFKILPWEAFRIEIVKKDFTRRTQSHTRDKKTVGAIGVAMLPRWNEKTQRRAWLAPAIHIAGTAEGRLMRPRLVVCFRENEEQRTCHIWVNRGDGFFITKAGKSLTGFQKRRIKYSIQCR